MTSSRRPSLSVTIDQLLPEARKREIEDATLRAAERASDAARRRRVAAVFRKLDSDHDGHLSVDQVTELLAALADGKQPSEEELDFMRKMSGWQPPFDHFNLADLADAMAYWQQYLEAFQTPDSWGSQVFSKYDTNGDSRLEIKELQALLTEMNGGEAVPDPEAEWVMTRADVLGNGAVSRIELMQAVSIWFQRTARLKALRRGMPIRVSGQSHDSQSCVCSLQ